MTPGCTDWRDAPAAEAVALVNAEVAVWRSALDWDVSDSWSVLEPARVSGSLPGLVTNAPDGAGWTCFLRHQATLQVAMLVADTAPATARLLDGILASPEAAQAETHVVCVRDGAPALREQLGARGFSVETYRYLAAPVTDDHSREGGGSDGWTTWQPAHLVRTAELLARAYPDHADVRAFAPHGTPAEWLEYVMTLVAGTGCGALLPSASAVIRSADSASLDAAIITTSLGAGSAHVAQVAVDPAARRRGLGRVLVATACARAAAEGHRQMTLMVSAANAAAGRLYRAVGIS